MQIPLWAALVSLFYLCKGKVTKVAKPTLQWGPGDPVVGETTLYYTKLHCTALHFLCTALHNGVKKD